MRFSIVLMALFALCGVVRGEDPEDAFAKELENAGKPGSPEYREYLKKKAEREKALKPIKEALQKCLKDETADPSEALQAVKRSRASAKEFGIEGSELGGLKERSRAMGKRVVEFLQRLGDDEYNDTVAYAAQRYFDLEPEAKFNIWAEVFGPRERITPHDPALAQRGVEATFARSIEEQSDRDEVSEAVRGNLALLDKSKPADEDLPYCRLVWENKLLQYLYLAQRWEVTASELGLTDEQYQDVRQQAKVIATSHGKKLLAELKRSPTWPAVYEAKVYKLKLVFALVPARELGTTERAAASLVNKLMEQFLSNARQGR